MLIGTYKTSQQFDDAVHQLKAQGASVTFLTPEDAHAGDCPNCQAGWHYLAYIVGGPYDQPPAQVERDAPWRKGQDKTTKANAAYLDGKWYSRLIRPFKCPVCNIVLDLNDWEPTVEKSKRVGRTATAGDIAKQLSGWGK